MSIFHIKFLQLTNDALNSVQYQKVFHRPFRSVAVIHLSTYPCLTITLHSSKY